MSSRLEVLATQSLLLAVALAACASEDSGSRGSGAGGQPGFPPGSGGAFASGGTFGTGGILGSGGVFGTGGAPGSGGTLATGGTSVGTGGAIATGGDSGSDGGVPTGDASSGSDGGSSTDGGSESDGGVAIDGSPATDASVSTGGGPSIDGSSSTGGNPSSDGSVSTGGSSALDGSISLDGSASLDGSVSFDGSADGDSADAGPRPECIAGGSQVILLGDSYVTWISHTFPADLNAEAGMTFRNYAVGGSSMATGGLGMIPPQLDQALAQDPDIKVIVMTGGLTDITVPDTIEFPQGGSCKNDSNAPNIPDCQAIVQEAVDEAASFMDAVAQLGVTDVVYFFYPQLPEGTLIGGTAPNAIFDYARDRMQAACEGAEAATTGALRCHFVDLVPVFEGHPEYFAPADIHPNSTGSAAMAEAVWRTMQDACIGQVEASGCCEPVGLP